MRCKITTTIIAAAIIATGCESIERPFDYEFYGLNCPVKAVSVKTYHAENRFGEILKGDLTWDGHYLATFNEAGNIESIQSFDADGDLRELSRHKHNKDNMLVEVASYDNDGEIEYSISFDYDNDKHTTSTTNKSYWSGTEETRVYNYIWKNDEIVEINLTMNGELISKTLCNEIGKNHVEKITYDKDGNEILRETELTDDKGRIKEIDKQDLHIEITWNEKNLPIYLKNAHLHNNTHIATFSEGEESILYAEYEYDSKGNWIKQIVYEGDNKRPLTISERVITY